MPQVGQWCEANATPGVVAEQLDRLGDVPRPGPRVSDLGAAQGQQVVQVVGDVLGQAERPPVREVEVHLGRRLGPGRDLEDDPHPVERLFLPGVGDVERRRQQPDRAGRSAGAEPDPHLPGGAHRQRRAGVVQAPAQHRHPGVDVLGDRVLEESVRGDDRYRGARVHHPEHAAEVVDVRMGVDHGGDRPVAPVLPVQRQPGRGDLGRHRRVDDDHAGLALDHGHVGKLDPAQLVDALGDREQPLDRGQLALPPQARVHRVRAVPGGGAGERVGVVHHPAVGGLDHPRLKPGDQPAVRVLEVGSVSKIRRHPQLPHRTTRPGSMLAAGDPRDFTLRG